MHYRKRIEYIEMNSICVGDVYELTNSWKNCFYMTYPDLVSGAKLKVLKLDTRYGCGACELVNVETGKHYSTTKLYAWCIINQYDLDKGHIKLISRNQKQVHINNMLKIISDIDVSSVLPNDTKRALELIEQLKNEAYNLTEIFLDDMENKS